MQCGKKFKPPGNPGGFFNMEIEENINGRKTGELV